MIDIHPIDSSHTFPSKSTPQSLASMIFILSTYISCYIHIVDQFTHTHTHTSHININNWDQVNTCIACKNTNIGLGSIYTFPVNIYTRDKGLYTPPVNLHAFINSFLKASRPVSFDFSTLTAWEVGNYFNLLNT